MPASYQLSALRQTINHSLHIYVDHFPASMDAKLHFFFLYFSGSQLGSAGYRKQALDMPHQKL